TRCAPWLLPAGGRWGTSRTGNRWPVRRRRSSEVHGTARVTSCVIDCVVWRRHAPGVVRRRSVRPRRADGGQAVELTDVITDVLSEQPPVQRGVVRSTHD